MTLTLIDSEAAVRSWLRAANTSNGSRVFFGFPDNPSQFPLTTIPAIDESPDPYVPDHIRALVSFHVWAPSKAQAYAAKNEVVVAAATMANGTPMGASARGKDATVRSSRWAPDPDDGMPRYIVDVEFLIGPA